MDRDGDYSFRYFSPSIVQGEPHEFCLEYSDSQGTIMFGGYERDHASGGLIHFLSPADWDELYPTRKGQREIIKARLRRYCRSKRGLRDLERSLRDDRGVLGSLLTRVGKVDLVVAVAIALMLLANVVSTGDPLQFGVWYYLLIPGLLVSVGVFFEAPPPYLTGASLAAALSLLIVWSADDPGGPVGTGHLVSLPLAMFGYVVGLSLARTGERGMRILVLGFFGWGGGFLFTQLYMARFKRLFGELSIFS